MAHVVGVPKRDPCQKCQLPVFLAERLLIGNKVYHRTCLKCARCGYQLSPGSFYETEVDGEYCCETCPDEEINTPSDELAAGGVSLRHGGVSEDTTLATTTHATSSSLMAGLPKHARSSIADRLAFFEHAKQPGLDVGSSSKRQESSASSSSKMLLQKSVSDEEKSKSLQRIEAQPTTSTSYKMNSALSSFLNDAIDGEGEDTDSKSDTQTQMETSDTENDSDAETKSADVAPALPKTQPPRLTDEMADVEQATSNADNLRFTATANLQLTTAEAREAADAEDDTTKKTNESKTAQMPIEKKTTELQLNLGTTSDAEETVGVQIKQHADNTNNNGPKKNNMESVPTTGSTEPKAQNQQATAAAVEAAATNKLNLSETNSNEDFTKDQIANTNIIDAALIIQAHKQTQPSTNTSSEKFEILRANLRELDTESETENSQDTTNAEKSVEMRQRPLKSTVEEDAATTERLSVVRARLQQFEVIANKRNNNKNDNDNAIEETRSIDRDAPNEYNKIGTTNNMNKLSERDHEESASTNNVQNKKLLKTVEAETTKMDVPASAIINPDDTESIPKENLEDETKLRAIEYEKAEQIETKINELNALDKPNIVSNEEVPLNLVMETGKDNNVVVVDVRDNKPETDVKPLRETPKIEVSKAKESEIEKKSESEDLKLNETESQVKSNKIDYTSKAKTPTVPSGAVAKSPNKIDPNEYPEDLNPFKSDDDDEDGNGDNKENQHNPQQHQTVVIRTPQPRTNTTPASDVSKSAEKSDSLNPFDSSDDEVELEKSTSSSRASTAFSTPSSIGKVPPPRPPPPRISRNPFGEETLDENAATANFSRRSSLSSSLSKKTPVPTPRTNLSQSQNPTPEPTPRLGTKSAQQSTTISPYILQNSSDYYGSANSLGSTGYNNSSNAPPYSLQRSTDGRGSNNSLTSSAGGTVRSRKTRRAPAPPIAPISAKELFPETITTVAPPTTAINDRHTDSSKASTPSSSTVGTPKSGRKKRRAPAPPKPARLDPSLLPPVNIEQQQQQPQQASEQQQQPQHTNESPPKNSINYPLQSETSDSKLSDEEKALLEGNQLSTTEDSLRSTQTANAASTTTAKRQSLRRLIPLDARLLEDDDDGDRSAGDNGARGGECGDDGANANIGKCDDAKQKQQLLRLIEQEEETNVVYWRAIVPPNMETPTPTHQTQSPLLDSLHDRQLEKLKDNKEAPNRNRQSQISASSGTDDCDISAATTPYNNKSSHGKWKRRKGPAPALPVPPRKVLQMLPLQEIRHELEIIEVQQQGLEKQGVILEKMIRDRCEGKNGELLGTTATATANNDTSADDGRKPATSNSGAENVQNSKEVEDLILQLFELVNEKNELFRRQAELMYLRRQHRLEQEQADLEYEIRVLMAQPERNKTDSDKAREEALIARLVEVVQLRNEVVECLEMDRLREAEEDLSIKQRLEMHAAQRDEDTDSRKITAKLSKKEKKKQKESKKLGKSKKIDADKDADESELNVDKQKLKKKKRKFLF